MTAGEMKYRAKGKITGGWLYGEKLTDQISGTAAIVTYVNLAGDVTDLSEINIYAVYPETLGRFTGLPDRNNKEIFEGDILEFCCDDECAPNGKNICFYKVEWKDEFACFVLKDTDSVTDFAGKDFDFFDKSIERKYFTVIGNIYDNPELLKGDNDDKSN